MAATYSGTPNTIVLRGGRGHHVEALALAALKPGHLLEYTSALKLKKHAQSGGPGLKIFAKEDDKQGFLISDAYAADDLVFAYICEPGDKIYARLAANAAAVTKGDVLISAGDGTLMKLGSGSSAASGGLLYSATAASTAHTNTTTEALFDKNYTIPANFLKVGDVIRVKAQAIATVTNSTDTLTLVLYIGGLTGTAIITTGAVDVANGDIGYIEADIVIRTVGASGTFVATGTQALGVPGTVTAKPWLKASTTIDTTAAQQIGIGADWSVASASNSARLDVLDIQLIRAGGIEVVGVAEETVDNSASSDEAMIKTLVI